MQDTQGHGLPTTAGSEVSELVSLKEHQQAWEAFATGAVRMIPV
jgi:hypothetical protein